MAADARQPPTDAAAHRRARLAREAALLDEGREDIRARRNISGDRVDAWLDRLDGRWRHGLAAILLVPFLLFGAASGQVVDRETPTIADLFHHAGRVVEARIDDASKTSCGTGYQATVVTSFKGGSRAGESEIIRFGRSADLHPGTTYLLFLSYIADPWELMGRIPLEARARYADREILDAIRCGGLVPGYEYDGSVVGELHDARCTLSIAPGFFGMPRDLPQPVLRSDRYAGTYVITRKSLVDYLGDLGRVSAEDAASPDAHHEPR